MYQIHPQRIHVVNTNKNSVPGTIIYWMSRDQRVQSNWALLYAAKLANENKNPLIVVFTLTENFLGATERHYSFMIKGLMEVEQELTALHISFELLVGNPSETMIAFCNKRNVSTIITDFDPLKIKNEWRKTVLKKTKVSFIEVDTHNIVPCRVASSKQEFGARTLRPKIHKLLPEFLDEIPIIKAFPKENFMKSDHSVSKLKMDRPIKEILSCTPGYKAAKKCLEKFLKNGLDQYVPFSDDPTQTQAVSNLSPYLHFGQISAQEVATTILKNHPRSESVDVFIEQLIVRKELSDNYCFYNSNYDNYQGIPDWGKKTLDFHRRDEREYLYSDKEFEEAQTHDHLWNAAQKQMVNQGKMHGYMRMYWCKKILEWTVNPEEAIRVAIWLNDKYSLDGRDPNGYTGIMWAIGGLHDRPWSKREIFGNIRYMNDKGCKRNFDVNKYIQMNS